MFPTLLRFMIRIVKIRSQFYKKSQQYNIYLLDKISNIKI